MSSNYDLQTHLQYLQRRCSFSQTALQWFEVFLDLSLVLPVLSSVLPGLSSALPGGPQVVPRLSMSMQIFRKRSHVRLKATALVLSTLGFDLPGILVQQLPNTPWGSQWHSYILLMWMYIEKKECVLPYDISKCD